MNIAIITGASSGMGEEFARRLIQEKDRYSFPSFDEMWLIARSGSKLQALAASLDPDKVRPVPLDLTKNEDISAFSARLSEEKPDIALLINCAGMGKSGAFSSHSAEDVHATVTLNCTALSEITHICLPYMNTLASSQNRKNCPRIINIASSAGFLPQPNFALYAATKSMVISFSRALHQELKKDNITVTCVCPGPCDTNFIKVSKNDPGATFTGFKAKFVTSVDKLIPASLRAAEKGRNLLVFGTSQKALHLASKILPTGLILFFESKML